MDAGLFGPTSVSWRVHADPMFTIGGIRALLLQTLHPLAMAGVSAHSAFRDDPWGRLLRTGGYVGTLTFGTQEQARRAAARVRGLHSRVRGVDPVSRRPYRASDPELLRWVHVCEVESLLAAAVRGGLALTADEIDRYYAEQVRAGELAGIPAELIPASAAAVADYYSAMRPQLEFTAEARDTVRFILHPPMPRRVALLTPARPGWYSLAGLAVALLPPWARRMLGLPGLPTTDLAATVAAHALRRVLLTLPTNLREGPNLRQAKARLNGAAPDATAAAGRTRRAECAAPALE